MPCGRHSIQNSKEGASGNDDDEDRIGFDHGDNDDERDNDEGDNDEGDNGENRNTNESWEELSGLSKVELKKKLTERGLKVSGNKLELIERLLEPKEADFINKPKLKAKALLIRLLSDKKTNVHNMNPEQVWNSSEWFKKYDKDRSISNMKNLKKSLDARDKVVALNNQTIAAELAAFAIVESKR